MEEDEFQIDFGKYIATLVRQWQMVVGFAAAFAIIAAVISFAINRAPPVYEAEVLIASTKTQSSVSFGSAIKTTTEGDPATQAQSAAAQISYDRSARLQSFVTLVNNVAVAEKVLAEMGPKLNQDNKKELTPSSLMGKVTASLIERTDTISIKVRYSDPQIAADIANAWGKAYIEQINALYGSSGGTSYLAVQQQTVQSKADYDKVQTALTDFVAHNRVDEYNRQIGEISLIVTNLRAARSTAVSTIVTERMGADQKIITELYNSQAANQLLALQQDQTARRLMVTAYMDAQSKARQEVFNQQVQDRIEQFSAAYADRRKVKLLLDDTTGMREAVKNGGAAAAASNTLALTLLKAQIYASFAGTNNLQVQNLPESLGASISSVTAQGMLADLDALIGTLTKRQGELDTLIDTLSKQLQNGENFNFLDASLDATGALAQAIETRYPELFARGKLSSLSLDATQNGNPLQSEALARSQDLLQLKGLEDVITFSTKDTAIEKKIVDLEQQIRDLNALISQESAKLQELTRSRDLAWQSYTALATKETELNVSTQTIGVEVALASPATPPDDRIVAAKTGLNVGIAGVLGMILGVLIAYGYEFWQNYNNRPIQSIRLPLKRFSRKNVIKG